MPRAARIAQADIARAMRAIEKAEGDWRLKILPDGSMLIEKTEAGINTPKLSVAAREDIRL